MKFRRLAQSQAFVEADSYSNQSLPSLSLIQKSQEMDLEYLSVREEICRSIFFQETNRHVRIRLKNWMQRLDQIISNPVWKRNRNHYIKLMSLMCHCEIVLAPFNQLPPKGDLPPLTKHQINQLIDDVERAVKMEKNKVEPQPIQNNDSLKPKQHWQQIRSLRSNSKVTYVEEDSSQYLGRFMDIAKRSQDLQMNESAFSHQIKKFNEKENQQSCWNKSKNEEKEEKEEKQTVRQRNSTYYLTPPKQISLQLSHQAESSIKKPTYFLKNNPPQTDHAQNSEPESQSSPPVAYRDAHQSLEIESNTLKTQMFENQLSINLLQPCQEETITTRTQGCDFAEQLSQRCRQKDEVHVKDYFVWRNESRVVPNNPSMLKKTKIVTLQLVPKVVAPTDRLEPEADGWENESCQIQDYHGMYENIELEPSEVREELGFQDITGRVNNQLN